MALPASFPEPARFPSTNPILLLLSFPCFLLPTKAPLLFYPLFPSHLHKDPRQAGFHIHRLTEQSRLEGVPKGHLVPTPMPRAGTPSIMRWTPCTFHTFICAGLRSLLIPSPSSTTFVFKKVDQDQHTIEIPHLLLSSSPLKGQDTQSPLIKRDELMPQHQLALTVRRTA